MICLSPVLISLFPISLIPSRWLNLNTQNPQINQANYAYNLGPSLASSSINVSSKYVPRADANLVLLFAQGRRGQHWQVSYQCHRPQVRLYETGVACGAAGAFLRAWRTERRAALPASRSRWCRGHVCNASYGDGCAARQRNGRQQLRREE